MRLLYLTTTRPDIAFVVQSLSQFMHSPKRSHMEAALRLVTYVKHATDQPADSFTKGLGRASHVHLMSKLGIKNIYIPPSLRRSVKKLSKCADVP
ncbi:hypothetical protein MTR67_003879 [Solanum verrucosum]|uniref:Uncharacterized protein n=1 Tax=Solanum verrucosum TaxID=315347 RepID=A0AAF0TA22_SOLVR|nr:hypothetical protein MTR67_003879 [Solanum verrucosum]